MFIMNARFATLLALCGIATGPLVFYGGVHAAAIDRNTHKDASNPRDVQSLEHAQALLSSPWAQKSRRHLKVRSLDEVSTRMMLINSLLTYFQNRRSLNGHSHKEIVIPNSHGGSFFLNHTRRGATTPQWMTTPNNKTTFNSTSTATPAEWTPGIVELMSGQDSKAIAFLTEGTYNNTQVLEATDKKQEATTMTLSKASASSRGSHPEASEGDLVNLCLKDKTPTLCATFHRKAMYDQPIQLLPMITDPSSSNMTQLFFHNNVTNTLTPVSFARNDTAGGDHGHDHDHDRPLVAAGLNSTSTSPTSTALPSQSVAPNRREDHSSSSNPHSTETQNVTLVFVPDNSSRTNAVEIKDASPSTSTVTQTSTVTVYSSGYPTSSAARVAGVPASSAPSSSTPSSSAAPSARESLAGMNVELLGNLVSSSTPVPSSPASTSSASGNANVANQSQAGPSSIPASASSSASVTASPRPTSSVNAAAIAASIADSYKTAATYSASKSASASIPASSSAATPLSAAAFAVASASASPSASAVSTAQPAAQSVLVAEGWNWDSLKRDASEVEVTDTEPYTWKFSPESR